MGPISVVSAHDFHRTVYAQSRQKIIIDDRNANALEYVAILISSGNAFAGKMRIKATADRRLRAGHLILS